MTVCAGWVWVWVCVCDCVCMLCVGVGVCVILLVTIVHTVSLACFSSSVQRAGTSGVLPAERGGTSAILVSCHLPGETPSRLQEVTDPQGGRCG